MKVTHANLKDTERGNALVSVILIILVLIVGGFYFYRLSINQAKENKAARERALLEAEESTLPANVYSGIE